MKAFNVALGLLVLASCDAANNSTQTGGTTGSGGTITGGTSAAVSTSAAGGTTAAASTSATGGTTSASTAAGGSSASGGNPSTSSTLSPAGGNSSPSGGSTVSSSSSGGTTTGGSRGSAGSSTGGGSAAGGSTAAGGTTSTGGSMAVDGGAGRDGGGADVRPADGSADRLGDARGGGTTGTGGTATGGAGGTVTGGTGGTATGGTGGMAAGGSGGNGGSPSHVGFYVNGRYLYDPCGEKVVLRGVNEMVVYSGNKDGTPYFSEIAKTGANSVRITWNTGTAGATPAKLGAAIANAIAAQMIPMPVLNDATGNLSALGTEITYWTRSDIVAIIKKYQDKLLVNVGNEVGDGSVTDAAFTSAYTGAITQMRNAGIHTPLVIDGSSWGQNIDQLQSTGPGLLTSDPDHNLIFSCHMYWNDPNGTKVTTEIAQTVSLNLPLIVGEFAQHAVSGCSSSPFAYKVLLSVAQTSEIGWLPWSWGGVKNSDCAADQPFDMTSNGTFAGLRGWGLEVAVTDPNSIQKTSKRSKYMTTGSCN